MKYKILAGIRNFKFQLFIALTIVLFFFKLFRGGDTSFITSFFNEVLVILTAAFFILYLFDFINSKKLNPLALVMNVGILNAILFFMITFSDTIIDFLFTKARERFANPDLLTTIISFVYAFIIISAVSYIFMTFKELYFLKQKRSKRTYFNTMIIFFLLASLATIFKRYPDLKYIKTAFVVISVILIFINSVKISWIAFLTKKEKVSLLVLSVVIAVLFSLNVNRLTDVNSYQSGFSTALNQFAGLMFIYGIIYFSILFFTTLFHLPTAAAYDRKAQEISSLQYFSRLINQVLDFKELAETVTEITLKVCNADSAWILWNNNSEQKTLGNINIGLLDASLLSQFINSNDFDRLENKAVILSIDKFKGKEKLTDKYYSVAVAPLRAHNQIKGFLVAAKKNDSIFDDEDKDAIITFSEYASVAIENSRLLQESIEKERLEKELDLAREIQRKIIPATNPQLKNLSISSVFIPAFEVGGDYYDFFEHNEKRIGFVIADVSGKGISAAFIMAELKGIFESLAQIIDNPKDILVKANQILKRTLDRRNFVSAAYGIIDIENESLELARAGHCPIYLLRDNQIQSLRPSGIGLGLSFTGHFTETLNPIKINLKENDLIILYTDGITEAKNGELEDFGTGSFERILIENSQKDVEEITNKVIKEVTLFSQNISQHDDITLVILKWKQKFNSNGENEWQNSAPQLQTKVM